MRSARRARASRPQTRTARRPSIEGLERRALLTGPGLSLSLAGHSVVANSGAAVTTGTLTRTGTDNALPLTVQLTSSIPSAASVPASVVIPAGQASTTFGVNAPAGDTATSNQVVTISGSAVADAPLAHDSTFVTSNQGFIVEAVAVGANGKVVVGGDYYTGNSQNYYDFAVARYNADGTPDTTFNGGAVVHTEVAGVLLKVQAVTIQADGKVIAAGVYQTSGNSHFNFAVARYNADGSLDTTFGTNGLAQLTPSPGSYNEVWALAIQSDGKILLGGDVENPAPNYGEYAVARLNATGHLDPTYGTGGIVQVDFSGGSDRGFSLAIQADGKAVLAGSSNGGNQSSHFALARFTAAGALDPTFGAGGKVQTDIAGDYEEARGVAIQPDGKIIAAGYASNAGVSPPNANNFVLARYNPDGSLDSTFGTGGVVNKDLGGNDQASSVVLLPDGLIVAGGVGGASSTGIVARFLPNGAFDASATAAGPDVAALATMPGGRVAVASRSDSLFNVGTLEAFAGTAAVSGSDTLTVTPAATPPVANDDSYTTGRSVILNVAAPGVLANDTDPLGLRMLAVKVADPAHGSVVMNTDGSFTYIPVSGYVGNDSFTYYVNDGRNLSNTATVNLTIIPANRAPVAVDDAFTIANDPPGPVGVPQTSVTMVSQTGDYIGQGKTYNWTPSNTTITAQVLTGGAYANAVEVDVFVPASGQTSAQYWSFDFAAPDQARLVPGTYNGATRWPFQPAGTPGINVSGDGRGNNQETGQFTVTQADYDAQGHLIAFAASFLQRGQNSVSTLTGLVNFNASPNVLTNDNDPDNDPITATVVAPPSHGTVTLNPGGSFVYTPAANYAGPDSFTYKANDGTLDGNVATVHLAVTSVDRAPVAVNDTYTASENVTLTSVVPGVLGNDSDPDGDPITAVVVTQPAHGALTFHADGSFSYVPALNYFGTDTFTYKTNDSALDSNVATVSLVVARVDRAPVAVGDAYTANVGVPLTIPGPGVLGNDSDPDGDPINAILMTQPTHGSLTFQADGSFNYTPATGYLGSDSFTYKVNDGSLDGNVATVSLSVIQPDRPPVASSQALTVVENGTKGVPLSATDPDGDQVFYTVVASPTHGSLSGVGASLTYTPSAGYSGADSFTFKASDGTLDSNVATVSITVKSPMTGAGVSIRPVANQALAGTVATFNDAFPVSASSYNAMIAWGDGHSSAGQIVANGPNAFAVNGTNTYASGGTRAISVTITDPIGRTVTLLGSAIVRAVGGDYNGDGKADQTVYRPSTGAWYIKDVATTSFGWAGHDVPLPADYNGDGKVELGVYRSDTGQWFTQGGPASGISFGWAGHDTPVPGVYDLGGKAEFAVYRPSTGYWYILNDPGSPGRPSSQTSVLFGWANHDKPVPADYLGLGFDQIAVYRPDTGEWFIRKPDGTTTTPFAPGQGLGLTKGDIPVPGDYDGIGRTEVAIYRPSTAQFLIFNPITSKVRTVTISGGKATDIPVPEDYTGDGKVDAAVFRPSTAQWIVVDSTTGTATGGGAAPGFGWANHDIALPGPLTYRVAGSINGKPGIPAAAVASGSGAKSGSTVSIALTVPKRPNTTVDAVTPARSASWFGSHA